MSYDAKKLVEQTERLLRERHDLTLQTADAQALHQCLSEAVMDQLAQPWANTRRQQAAGRCAFYFSAEYLIGRLIYSNLLNMGILPAAKQAFADRGVDLACLEEI